MLCARRCAPRSRCSSSCSASTRRCSSGSSRRSRRAAGPFSDSPTIGPLDLEVTVDPARTGATSCTSTSSTRGRRAVRGHEGADDHRVAAGSADRTAAGDAAALRTRPLHRGHHALTPGGTWRFAVTDRVSDFDEYDTTFDVRDPVTPSSSAVLRARARAAARRSLLAGATRASGPARPAPAEPGRSVTPTHARACGRPRRRAPCPAAAALASRPPPRAAAARAPDLNPSFPLHTKEQHHASAPDHRRLARSSRSRSRPPRRPTSPSSPTRRRPARTPSKTSASPTRPTTPSTTKVDVQLPDGFASCPTRPSRAGHQGRHGEARHARRDRRRPEVTEQVSEVTFTAEPRPTASRPASSRTSRSRSGARQGGRNRSPSRRCRPTTTERSCAGSARPTPTSPRRSSRSIAATSADAEAGAASRRPRPPTTAAATPVDARWPRGTDGLAIVALVVGGLGLLAGLGGLGRPGAPAPERPGYAGLSSGVSPASPRHRTLEDTCHARNPPANEQRDAARAERKARRRRPRVQRRAKKRLGIVGAIVAGAAVLVVALVPSRGLEASRDRLDAGGRVGPRADRGPRSCSTASRRRAASSATRSARHPRRVRRPAVPVLQAVHRRRPAVGRPGLRPHRQGPARVPAPDFIGPDSVKAREARRRRRWREQALEHARAPLRQPGRGGRRLGDRRARRRRGQRGRPRPGADRDGEGCRRGRSRRSRRPTSWPPATA